MRNYENCSRHADKFVVRLPNGLRSQVDLAAASEETSMNTVMIKAVRQYVEGQSRHAALLDALEQAVKARGEFDIDEHTRMARDAARYRHLRDRARIEDPNTDLLVIAGDVWFSGDELDAEIDTCLRLPELLTDPGEPV